jgi:hypothetical protein
MKKLVWQKDTRWFRPHSPAANTCLLDRTLHQLQIRWLWDMSVALISSNHTRSYRYRARVKTFNSGFNSLAVTITAVRASISGIVT